MSAVEFGPLTEARRGQPYVYLLLDAGDVPLYIGSTRDLRRRLRDHRRREWHVKVDRYEAYPQPTLDEALHAESLLIRAHNPQFNKQQRPDPVSWVFGMFFGAVVPIPPNCGRWSEPTVPTIGLPEAAS